MIQNYQSYQEECLKDVRVAYGEQHDGQERREAA